LTLVKKPIFGYFCTTLFFLFLFLFYYLFTSNALCADSTSVFDHNRLSWFLGGNYGGRGLSHRMPPPPPNPANLAISGDDSDAANSDAPSLAGSDSDDGSIESGASTDSTLPLGNSCGSPAAARFLTVVAHLWAVTIRSRWGQFQLEAGSSGVPTSTTGQRPNG
jgi:hypothetical protein